MTTNRIPTGVDFQNKKLTWDFTNDEFKNLTVNYLPLQCYAAGGLNKYALIGTQEYRDRFNKLTFQLCKSLWYPNGSRERFLALAAQLHNQR